MRQFNVEKFLLIVAMSMTGVANGATANFPKTTSAINSTVQDGGLPTDAPPELRVLSGGLTYWYYSPHGKDCQVFPFDPNDAQSKANAKSACEKHNGAACVEASGKATPAC